MGNTMYAYGRICSVSSTAKLRAQLEPKSLAHNDNRNNIIINNHRPAATFYVVYRQVQFRGQTELDFSTM